ncbi:DUF7940 domain-containing protein [Massilia pseudoviolaceinigra]|uniref:DUF7940 domain-containing protein n=1 Tax=Massilia pseudoviolaceinigra TaxID=3057165 RepID=UPI002796E172|nr:hypothetical protein [Massilia sp. CCM 9206]MDQ1921298.1 hypothetical protein [Massilia sp. CCM 9206]
MILIEDWRAVLAKAWSLKFNAAAGLLGAAEVYIALVQPAGIPNGVFAGIAAVVSLLAFGARLLAQREFNGTDK